MNTIIVPPLGSKKQSSNRKLMMILGIIIGLGILTVFTVGVFFGSDDTVDVEEYSVLKLTLPAQVSEYGVSSNIFDDSTPLGFYAILETIRKAEIDPRIKGMYIPIGESQMGFVKLEEMLEALRSFKSKGKFIYAYMETAGRSDYMMVSLADSIFMPKEGLAELSAPGVSALFFKNLFAKIGVTMYVQQFEEYKSAGETFSQERFTPPAKEELNVIIQSRANRMYELISKQRKLPLERVKAAFDVGTYTADSLKSYSLIDAYAQEWEVRDFIKKKVESIRKKETSKTDTLERLSLINVQDYSKAECKEYDQSFAEESSSIAIVNAVGAIRSGTSGNGNPFDQGAQEIASGSLVKDLKRAYENENVKAVILRIDSPGGSVIASDEVWSLIQSIKKKKPIYASMSDVAASGGYYIPMACDTIIAHPQTITGSIGVIGMFPIVSEAMAKVGITMDTISTGASSQDMNLMLPMNEARKKKLYDQMYPIYQRFVSKVAKSRNMEYEQARSVAKGRVWLGNDAHQRKLIDTLGGLELAVSLAKKRIGIPADKRARIISYPKSKDFLSELLSSMSGDTGEDETASFRNIVSTVLGNGNVEVVIQTMPTELKAGLASAFSAFSMARKEQVLALMPYIPQF
ncbi:MAG: signal peptide peptidase SppA [Ignavibacteria bacterium]|jgi:protease-4